MDISAAAVCMAGKVEFNPALTRHDAYELGRASDGFALAAPYASAGARPISGLRAS